jgi:hypothetical protein
MAADISSEHELWGLRRILHAIAARAMWTGRGLPGGTR